MSDIVADIKRMADAMNVARSVGRELRYKLAVDRDNRLTQAELIPYIEGLIWSEQRRNDQDDTHA